MRKSILLAIILISAISGVSAPKKVKIAVLDFMAGPQVMKKDAVAINALFLNRLKAKSILEIMDANSMNRALKQNKYKFDENEYMTSIAEAGRILDKRYVITGWISRLPRDMDPRKTKYLVNVVLVDVARNRKICNHEASEIVSPRQAWGLAGFADKVASLVTSPDQEIVVDTIKAGTVKTIAGIELVFVPSGAFYMGSGGGNTLEQPPHEVKVKGFWMGKYEVTQKQYEEIMESNPSFSKKDVRPVEQVTWNDAQEFCKKFSARHGVEIRLPTEAEWEYACKAGGAANDPGPNYYWGNEMNGDYCWYEGNSYADDVEYFWVPKNMEQRPEGKNKGTHPVGQKKPNAFGLYDMLGNVWELCEDPFDYYPMHKYVRNYNKHLTREEKVIRGASWFDSADMCRSTYRQGVGPLSQGFVANVGFRVAMTEK